MNNLPLPPSRLRADALLAALGLADSRSRARDLIRRGRVCLADGTILDKPSRLLPPDTLLRLVGEAPPVSRAGEKLAAFLDQTKLCPDACTVLDIGASTGGFTDCLLRRGATLATCVDVGHGQLHPRLAQDPRVTRHDGINARNLSAVSLQPVRYDWVVIDVSFISLRLIWTAAWPRLCSGGTLICLIKPQFEAPRDVMRKCRGVLRDANLRTTVIAEVLAAAEIDLDGARLIAHCDAAFAGEDGNLEAFAAWQKA